jgi:hypothetical protein
MLKLFAIQLRYVMVFGLLRGFVFLLSAQGDVNGFQKGRF